MKVRWPAAEFLLVQMDKAESMSKGGIALPDKEKVSTGQVMAVGGKVHSEGLTVDAGDRVVWQKNAIFHAVPPKEDGIILIHMDEIRAVIE